MSRHEEISRFHAGGKTFFFNRGRARNGNDYLAIKGLWGKGNQEQLVLFPGQMVEFYQKFRSAMAAITGLQPAEDAPEPTGPTLPNIPVDCPACPHAKGVYELSVFGENDWKIACPECGEAVFDTEEI